MKIILLENVENVGNRGAVVNVKDGFARNFLVPRSLALEATPGNVKVAQQKKKHYEVQLIKEKAEAEELAKTIAGLSCTVVKKVGEGETLYGAVTNSEIAAVISPWAFSARRTDGSCRTNWAPSMISVPYGRSWS